MADPDPTKRLPSFNVSGYFMYPPTLAEGDPFDKAPFGGDRHRGRQFTTNNPKRGQSGDTWNQGRYYKMNRLFEGELHKDPDQRILEERRKSRPATTNTTPFRRSSPAKRPAGNSHVVGNFGTIGPRLEHLPDGDPPAAPEGPIRLRPKTTGEIKPLYTSPAKRGSYGFAGTTLSKGSEYKYEADPYDPVIKKKQDYLKPEGTSEAVFRPSNRSNDFFDTWPHVPISRVYTADGPLPPEKRKPPPPPKLAAPWRPSSPPKKGWQGQMGAYPAYVEDPEDARRAKEAAARRAAADASKLGPPFRDPSPYKSKRTPSIQVRPYEMRAGR